MSAAVTPKAAATLNLAGFRVSLGDDVALVEATVDAVTVGLHTPFRGRPDRMPKGAHLEAWAKWWSASLPLAIRRISELILVTRRIGGFGREYVREFILQPLADLNGDVVIPRAAGDSIGTADQEIAEAATAVSAVLVSVDRGESASARATKISAAQRELGDLLQVSR